MFWLPFGEKLQSFQGTKLELPAELAAPCSASSSGHVANSGCCKLNQEQSALVSARANAASAACVASRMAIVCVRCFSLGRLLRFFSLRCGFGGSFVPLAFRKLGVHRNRAFPCVPSVQFCFVHCILSLLTHPSFLSGL